MKRLVAVLVPFLLFLSCTQNRVEVRSKGVALHDETVIHYREAGQGPVLILVHGMGSSADFWSSNIRQLARSFRVIAIDLPGYGKSDPPKRGFSIPVQADLLTEFIDHLHAGKVSLAGNSLGGWITALVALDHPDKVHRLILIDSAGLRRSAPAPVNLNPASREEEQVLLHAVFADQGRVTEKLVNDQWEYRKRVRASVEATQASFRTDLPLLDGRLKDIAVPTLIIWGKQDLLIPVAAAEQWAGGIRGSELIVIDRAGHAPNVERPEAFVHAVNSFLKSR